MNKKNLIFGLLLTASVGFLGISKSILSVSANDDNVFNTDGFTEGVDYVDLNKISFDSVTSQVFGSVNRYRLVTATLSGTIEEFRQMGLISFQDTSSGGYHANIFTHSNLVTNYNIAWSEEYINSYIVDITLNNNARSIFLVNDDGLEVDYYNRLTPNFANDLYANGVNIPLTVGLSGMEYMFNSFIPFSNMGSSYVTSANADNILNYTLKFITGHANKVFNVEDVFVGKYFGTYAFAVTQIHDYDIGYTEGYEDGQQNGYDNGYDSGYIDGYDDGMNTGYDNGYDDGRQVGYDLGVENTEITGTLMGSTIYMVIGSIANFIVSISAFEVMGLSIGSIVAFIVTVGLTIFILGIVRK